MATFKVFDINSIPTAKDLLNEYLVNIVTTHPAITDISVGSKLWTMGYATSRALASAYYTLHFFRKQSFVMTASGKYLDLHGIEVGLTRQLANYARGQATFSRTAPAPYDLLIPSGTIITTPISSSDVPVIKYATTDDAIIKFGEDSVNVDIICLVPGEDGNQVAGSVTRIESSVAGAQYVTTTSISGGTTIEEDSSFRDRILTAWVARESGTKNAIINAVLGVQGIKNVIVVDPARIRARQEIRLDSFATNTPQVLLQTLSAETAKNDIFLTFGSLNTCTIEQIDNKGTTLKAESFSDIDSGKKLVQQINYWRRSATLKIASLAIDDNPYNDPLPVATDNLVAQIVTLSPEASTHDITFMIFKQPHSEAKEVVISTLAYYKRNEILGQTERSPIVESYRNIYTYAEMATKINESSKLIRVFLLNKKVAEQPLTPTYDAQLGKNFVVATFKPVTKLLSPIDNSVVLLDADNGIIDVGQATQAINIKYEYIARMNVNGSLIDFAETMPEDVIVNLEREGSDLVFATPVKVPLSDGSGYTYTHLEEPVKALDRTQLTSKYQMLRGLVSVTPIPYALGDEEATNTVFENVVTAIGKVQPAGVEVVLTKPTVQYVDVNISVSVIAESGYAAESFSATIIAGITNYINSLNMGETAYRDRIIAAANPNLVGLAVVRVMSPTIDIVPTATSFLRAGSVTINGEIQ